MAAKDLTAEVHDAAVALLRPILQHLASQVFAGPTAERLSKKEARDRLATLSPEERTALANQIGVDEFLRQARELEEN